MTNQPHWLQFADSIERTQELFAQQLEREGRRERVRKDLESMYEDDAFFLECLLSVWADKMGFEMTPGGKR